MLASRRRSARESDESHGSTSFAWTIIVPRVKHPFPLALAVTSFAIGTVALVAACATSEPSPSGPGLPDAANDASPRSQPPEFDSGGAKDAAPLSTCERTRAYVTACGRDELTCGSAHFDTWCALHDETMNSEAFRRAETKCLTTENCDPLDRRDCEYRSYSTASPTTAQRQVVAAYCETCEPTDPAGCAERKTTYNPALGPKSTDDVFVAAWDLSDAIDDEIRVKCTGPGIDAGADAATDGGVDTGACLKRFAACAGDIYVDHLPDCPK